jgi:hypothetical protein
MVKPNLTFFCELEAAALQELFDNPAVIQDLQELQAGVSLGILDLSAERAAVVRCLNEVGIPVIAWQLLPKEQGYWFSASNAHQATTRYAEFKAWTEEHGLQWAGVGIDIEPDMREAEELVRGKRRMLHTLLPRAFDYERMRRAQSEYNLLVAQMRVDGYKVDSYVFPLIIDERKAGSTMLRRLTGLVDVPSDREVPMLYSSFLRPRGAGTLWSYAPDVQAMAVGSTGGGVTVGGADKVRPLDWSEFSRDLRLARRWCSEIYVFSLEGCVRQDLLRQLKVFDWDRPFTPPLDVAAQINQFRGVLRTGLWLSAHPLTMLSTFLAVVWLVSHLRRRHS